MLIHRLPGGFAWPPPALPLERAMRGWHGEPVVPPVAFALAADDERLWLLAGRAAPATLHPDAVPGAFVAGLWRHDVTELFVGAAGEPGYMELNLGPTGAWWARVFDAPRVPRGGPDVPPAGIRTHADPPGRHGWRAAIGVPLAALPAPLDAGATANVAFVLTVPTTLHVSVAPPPPGPPDFHAPALRCPVRLVG